jgi:hypothetical protein
LGPVAGNENPAQQGGKDWSREAPGVAVARCTDRRTRPEEKKTENLCSEEKLDHLVGETTATATDPSITDRLIAKVEAHGRRSPLPGDDGFLDFIATVHRAGHITTGEALEGERTHRLVLAGKEEF